MKAQEQTVTEATGTSKRAIIREIIFFLLVLLVAPTVVIAWRLCGLNSFRLLMISYASVGVVVMPVYLVFQILRTPFENLPTTRKIRVYTNAMILGWVCSLIMEVLRIYAEKWIV